jgi:hypothetical protein
MRKSMLILAGLSLAIPALTPASAQTTVDQMTCAAAARSAAVSGRYYKRTSFGVVPIMPIVTRAGAARLCLSSEWAVPQIERTRDTPTCVVGFKCQEADPYEWMH